jgi:hypothetical protein
MNLRKQPVNRNASHGSPSTEDSKGNFKSGPNGLNKKHPTGVGDILGARGVSKPPVFHQETAILCFGESPVRQTRGVQVT